MALIRHINKIKTNKSLFSTAASTIKANSETAAQTEVQATKEPLIQKWKKYWKNLYTDYYEVAKDVIVDAKEKPVKAMIITTGLSLAGYSAITNPNMVKFMDKLTAYNNDIILVAENLQNPKTAKHMKFLNSCVNAGLLRRINLGVCSFIWIADYDADCKLYQCTCKYLQPEITTFMDRIVDIGLWNKWWILDRKLIDYDVNFEE